MVYFSLVIVLDWCLFRTDPGLPRRSLHLTSRRAEFRRLLFGDDVRHSSGDRNSWHHCLKYEAEMSSWSSPTWSGLPGSRRTVVCGSGAPPAVEPPTRPRRWSAVPYPATQHCTSPLRFSHQRSPSLPFDVFRPSRCPALILLPCQSTPLSATRRGRRGTMSHSDLEKNLLPNMYPSDNGKQLSWNTGYNGGQRHGTRQTISTSCPRPEPFISRDGLFSPIQKQFHTYHSDFSPANRTIGGAVRMTPKPHSPSRERRKQRHGTDCCVLKQLI